MSWRNILGLGEAGSTEFHYTQKSQNTQKTHVQANNAYIANIALSESELFDTIATACHNLPITSDEIRQMLTQVDIEDWHKGKISINELMSFAQSLVQRRMMDQGKVPSHYTKYATCKQCGPIWLWLSAEVIGCPWCWNRVAKQPIPRPLCPKETSEFA